MAVAPGLLPAGAALVPDDVAPTQLDGLPPELDADFATRVAEGGLAHVECQGYRDTGFEARTLWYHVGFALRNRGMRRVRHRFDPRVEPDQELIVPRGDLGRTGPRSAASGRAGAHSASAQGQTSSASA